jgi:putative flippase GtrA
MKEFCKYFFVGTIAALLDIFTFSLLTLQVGINYLIANVFSTCLGLLFNYYFSCIFVFRLKKINVRRDFLPFALIGFVGLGLQNLMLYLFIDLQLALQPTNLIAWMMNTSIDIKPISKIFVTGVIFLWNFFMRKYIVFKKAEKQELANNLK